MSDNLDLKTLWHRQNANDIPDSRELFEKAEGLKRRNRNKLIRLNLVLLATAAFILWMGFNIDHEKLTTKIGIAIILIAIASYLIAYNQMAPMLFKTSMESSSKDYLNQLIGIKRKLEFLNRVMINIYFILLSTGLALYMWQFALKMSSFWAIFWYVITFLWIAFAWFYLRPRGIKKKQKALNEMIIRLEEMNEQLKSF